MHTAVVVTLLLLTTQAFAQPTFINKIPIPPLYDAANDTIHLEMRVTTHKFNPGNPSDSLNGGTNQPDGIRTYCYNVEGDSTMTVLGPTLKWHTLENTNISVKNLIGIGSTTHWHGAEVPPQMDGGPHQPIEPGETWNVNFPTLDSACTMWYHPHYHNRTVQHVQKGLSGMILIEDENDPIRNTMPRTYGVDDIPVIIGDIGFTKSSNATDGMVIDTLKGKRPYNLVNGVTNPYIEVPAHFVRLRILNGSTRKGVMFGISESYDDPISDLKEFYLIATDGGYTLKPDTLTTLINGPGARDEIVIDLSNYLPGDVLYLSNLKELVPNSVIGSPLKAPNGGGQDTTMGTAFLQLRVVADNQFNNYTPVTSFTPFTTTWTAGLADTSNVARHRLKQLVMGVDTVSLNPFKTENAFTIDTMPFSMMVINDTVCVDTKEIWAIHNTTAVAHPFHIHKIQFRVLDIVDSLGNFIDLEERGLNGPKDDVLVFPGWTMRFLGQFNDYPSPIAFTNSYMYHCHILTHEDSIGGGMMAQFVVTDESPCTSSSVIEVTSNSPTMSLLTSATDGILYLKGQAQESSTVTIVNMQGRQMLNEQLPAFNGYTPINISELTTGLYLLEWRTEDGVLTGKVMVLE